MKAKTTGTLTAIALAVVAVGLVCFRSVSVEATYPVEHAKRTFADKVGARISGWFRGAAASAENVRLRREVGALAVVRAEAERIEAENERLRKVLDYAQRRGADWIAAAVLSRNGAAAAVHQTLRVDRGSLAGIREGAVVVAPAGLVGRVSKVTLHTSEITLVTDASVKVACEIETGERNSPKGLLSGCREELLVMRMEAESRRYLTQTNAPQSRVITSGCGGVFPRGIEVGIWMGPRDGIGVGAVEGVVMPSVDYSALEDVFIRREK